MLYNSSIKILKNMWVILLISIATKIAGWVKLLIWRLWLPCQLLQSGHVLLRRASPASRNRGRHWVYWVQLKGICWVMGQTAEHGLILSHSPLINLQRNAVSKYFPSILCKQQYTGHSMVACRYVQWKTILHYKQTTFSNLSEIKFTMT